MSFLKRPKKIRGPVQPQVLESHGSVNDSLATQPGMDVLNGDPGRPPFSVQLGNYELVFEDGQWHSDSAQPGQSSRELLTLRQQNKQLTEENHLLRFKVDVLLDMLAATRADYQTLDSQVRTALSKADH